MPSNLPTSACVIRTSSFALFIAGFPSFASCAEPTPIKPAPPLSAAEINRNYTTALQELPAGAAKELTAVACTRCHNLGGLSAYKGYWSRQQWYAMVESMVQNGSLLDKQQLNVVTDYLFEHYGRHPTNTNNKE